MNLCKACLGNLQFMSMFLIVYFIYFVNVPFLPFIAQIIQLLSAFDPDEPVEGHHFYFSMVPERSINPNFTIRDNQGRNTHVTYRKHWTASQAV